MEDLCVKCNGDRNINGFVKNRKKCKKCCNEQSRLYKQCHKKEISDYNKKYKSEHKEDIKTYNAKYNIENRETIQKRHTPYLINRRKTCPQYKISVVLRNRISALLKNKIKSASSLKLLGCSYDFLKEWFEYQFEEDMTFENHGTLWHIDHIIPCKHFDLIEESEQQKCFNWTNLQPLYAEDNLSKNSSIREKDITKNKNNIHKFLKIKKQNNQNIPELIKFDKEKYL